MSAHRAARVQSGWTCVELTIAMAIVATSLLVVVQQTSIGFREADLNDHRVFAYQKAAAILREIRHAVDTGAVADADGLVAFHDTAPNPVLTTRLDAEGLPVAPDHRMSGNSRREGEWTWSRRVTVAGHEQPWLYFVRVDIHRRQAGQWLFEANQTALLSMLPKADAPTQTFDVYALAFPNVPSLLGDLATLRDQLESAVASAAALSQARFRLHWVTRLGFGRDPCYAPYVNVEPSALPPPYAYWLPGALDGGGELYRAELLQGLHRREDGLHGAYANDNEVPFALADQWNHCLRTPAARRLYEARRGAGLEDGQEPPLQLLLADMIEQPERFRAAIVLNLHGAGLPMPPLRNYSDPAKDPVGRPGVRVVTHPARLHVRRDANNDGDHADTDDVELRVYAFRAAASGGDPDDVLAEPILVQIHGVDLSAAVNGPDPLLEVRRLCGGVDTTTGEASAAAAYSPFDSAAGLPPAGSEPHAPREMWFEAGFVAGADAYTWVKLHNTPLCAPKVGSRGLDAAGRLYGCEYNPSPVTTGGAFVQDLAFDSSNPNLQRNTARWRLRIKKSAFVTGRLPNLDVCLRVSTRIGTDTSTGVRWPAPQKPHNLSETWTWWTDHAADVPATERAQFLGDPRLLPYADLMADGATNPHGYNWHFDDLVVGSVNAAALYPAFDATRLQEGFGSGNRADAPRFHELLRTALQHSQATLLGPTGAFASAVLLGGEIAHCSEPLGEGSAPVLVPGAWVGSFAPLALDTVAAPAAGAAGGTQVLAADDGSGWWQKPWLGELFADADGARWLQSGNLAVAPPPKPLALPGPGGEIGAMSTPEPGFELETGPPSASPRKLVWCSRHLLSPGDLPLGTSFARPDCAAVGAAGAITLLNQGTPSATFQQLADAGPATPAAAAQELRLAVPLPAPSQYACALPLSMAARPGTVPIAFLRTDTYPRHSGTLAEAWAVVPRTATTGAALIEIEHPYDESQRAYFVPFGLTPAAGATMPVLQEALLAGVRATMVAGVPGKTARVPQPPLLTILSPESSTALQDPLNVVLHWRCEGRRFDSRPYTPGYPAGFSEDEQRFVYRVLHSRDLGAAWRCLVSDAITAPATFPQDAGERLADTGPGDETFTVPLPPEDFGTGEHVLRIEAFDLDRQCHCGSHQIRFVIRRT